MQKGRLLTGARARFAIDGKPIGYARNIQLGERLTTEPIEVIGNVEVEEYVVVGYAVTFTAGMFRIIGETLKQQGFFPNTGGTTEEHLQNILLSGEMTATIEATMPGSQAPKLIATVEQVKVTSHNYTVDARGVSGTDVEFNAIRVKDEGEI